MSYLNKSRCCLIWTDLILSKLFDLILSWTKESQFWLFWFTDVPCIQSNINLVLTSYAYTFQDNRCSPPRWASASAPASSRSSDTEAETHQAKHPSTNQANTSNVSSNIYMIFLRHFDLIMSYPNMSRCWSFFDSFCIKWTFWPNPKLSKKVTILAYLVYWCDLYPIQYKFCVNKLGVYFSV